MNEKSIYQEIKPISELKDFVHSFWTHQNNAELAEQITIVPDSYFKIVIAIKNNEVVTYFMTGLWTEEKKVTIAPQAFVVGCRLKVLAPEFLLSKEIAPVLNGIEQLDLQFFDIGKFDLSSFEAIVAQWQNEMIKKLPKKNIQGKKLRFSQLLDKMNGEISASEVSNQIYWSNRQINRYLNKYLGVSLKKYLTLQKCYHAYVQIREGQFFPEKGFFDQSHFIHQIKKHTGETPKGLYENQNDRFLQLKRISKK